MPHHTILVINPGNGSIRSGSDSYLAGAWVTVSKGAGSKAEPIRLKAADFERAPEETMSRLIAAIRGVFPRGRSEELADQGVLIHLTDGNKLYAWPDGVHMRDSDDNEEACWVLDEWANEPEAVIGAILGRIALSESSNLGALKAA